ncbi:hypothetical protein CRUP_032003, partial [Coryphaenoides rupestris]
MFSMVSSGMGATVCTAGRLLLVAPLTKEEEEEEDEEVAESEWQNSIQKNAGLAFIELINEGSQLHDFWRLDYWEDDLRRRRRFVRNAFGSTHADVSLKALEEY